jgi:hypothetical protein
VITDAINLGKYFLGLGGSADQAKTGVEGLTGAINSLGNAARGGGPSGIPPASASPSVEKHSLNVPGTGNKFAMLDNGVVSDAQPIRIPIPPSRSSAETPAARNFVPPSRPLQITLSVPMHIDIDGRTLADVLQEKIRRGNGIPDAGALLERQGRL